METYQIINLVSGAVLAIFNIIIVLIAFKKRNDAKKENNAEEEQKMNDIIKDQFSMAITNIKSLCNTNNLIFNAKQTNKIAKKMIKENKNNDN